MNLGRRLVALLFPLAGVRQSLEEIRMELSQVAEALGQIKDQLHKVKEEVVGKIDALQTELGNVQLPEAAVAALNELRAVTQQLDDIVPDAPAEPTDPQS